MPLQPAKDGGTAVLSSSDVVLAFVNRLQSGAIVLRGTPSAGYVRVTGAPDDNEVAAYKPEEGIHVTVGDTQPHVNDGAARYGKRVRRVMEVRLVTVSNQDRAGEQKIAMVKHLALEDMVFDVLDGTPPNAGASSWNSKIGVTCKWIPGGDAIKRGKKIDPSRFVSIHLFELIYVQRTSVPA